MKSLPNWLKLMFAGVRIVSLKFWPVRALSLCQVRTSPAKIVGTKVISARNETRFRRETESTGSTPKKVACHTPAANEFAPGSQQSAISCQWFSTFHFLIFTCGFAFPLCLGEALGFFPAPCPFPHIISSVAVSHSLNLVPSDQLLNFSNAPLVVCLTTAAFRWSDFRSDSGPCRSDNGPAHGAFPAQERRRFVHDNNLLSPADPARR